MIQCRMMLAIGLAWLVTGCGSADQRGIEAMVERRMGETTKLTYVSDPVIYRKGDLKQACVIVNYENNWGEEMDSVAIVGWYNFNNGGWFTDNPRTVDENFDCAEFVEREGGTILN